MVRRVSLARRQRPTIATLSRRKLPHDGVRRAPEPIQSGRGAGLGWSGAGTLPRVGEGSVCEDLPDDRGIVQRGDQAPPVPAMGTRQHVDAERPVHQGRPAPGARTGWLHPVPTGSPASGRRLGRGLWHAQSGRVGVYDGVYDLGRTDVDSLLAARRKVRGGYTGLDWV